MGMRDEWAGAILGRITPQEAWRMRNDERPDMEIFRDLITEEGIRRRWPKLWMEPEAMAFSPVMFIMHAIGWLAGSYLPPSHRARLAEAIGASDFADHPEVWERKQLAEWAALHHDAPLDARCRACDPEPIPLGSEDRLLRMAFVPVTDASSRWDYWVGQCPRCGVIYWFRGPERVGSVDLHGAAKSANQ
jgi:hypothetical protein